VSKEPFFINVVNDNNTNTWIGAAGIHNSTGCADLITVRKAAMYAYDDDSGYRFVKLSYHGTTLEDEPTVIDVTVTEEIFDGLKSKFDKGRREPIKPANIRLATGHTGTDHENGGHHDGYEAARKRNQ